jgi:RNA polymerase sigma-70 factor, ECF subfamily
MSSCSVVCNSRTPHLESGAVDEDVLIRSAQTGQEWAFVELCARNSKRVFNTIYGVTKNREDAEDALQDSMMRAFLHLKQFDGRSSFATWFTRIGINSALMILRKRRIRLETSMDTTEDDPEKRYVGNEMSMHLNKAICRLPNSLRSVIERGQLEGHSMKQIARNAGISVPATKSRLARAKVALRKSMVSTSGRPVNARRVSRVN